MTTTTDERMTHREARPGMASQRKKIHWASRLSSARLARDFNERFPIGTIVIYDGVRRRTECPAASNELWEPAVFLEGVECPVQLALIDIPDEARPKKPR